MRPFVATLAAVAAFAGCSKPQPTGEPSLSPSVTLEVVNNFSPPVQVTVFIVGQYGGRQVLGTLSPGRKGSFTYRPTNATDKFSFLAQSSSGRAISTQLFSLINVESVSWDMDVNLIKFYER